MIGELTCDICNQTIKGLSRLGRLGEGLSVPGRFEDMCPSCKYKIDNEIERIRGEVDQDFQGRVKDFIERLHDNPKIAKGPKKEA